MENPITVHFPHHLAHLLGGLLQAGEPDDGDGELVLVYRLELPDPEGVLRVLGHLRAIGGVAASAQGSVHVHDPQAFAQQMQLLLHLAKAMAEIVSPGGEPGPRVLWCEHGGGCG